jgi:transposase
MRGADQQPDALFSYVSPEQRVPQDHPLRPIRELANQALQKLSPAFAKIYAASGRPSIAPEKLLRALLVQVLYSVRSERLLMEQLDYNLLFRWFVGLSMDERVWNPTTFTKNRDRLLEGDIAQAFFVAVVGAMRHKKLLSDEHFSVDGTLLEAWASHKSFRPKDGRESDRSDDDPGNPSVDFRGQKRSNQTHRSTTDPEALLAKKSKGQAAKLSYAAHVLIENRNGIIVDTALTPAHGRAEEDAALWMVQRLRGARRVTLGGDKGYDDGKLIQQLRGLGVTPHVAQNLKQPGGSALDGRTTRHAGYRVSQRKRKRVEEVFGWMKTVGLLRKLRHRGRAKVGWLFTFAAAAYNLVRCRTLLAAEAT